MRVHLLSHSLVVAAACGALAACSGTGQQTTPPTATAGTAGSSHAPSAFSGAPTTLSSARAAQSAPSSTCTTVAVQHGTLTAAVVATGTIDHAKIDATGCQIGIYIGPASNGQKIDHTDVHDATEYGIYAYQAQNITIDHTQVYKIGVHDSSGNFAPGPSERGGMGIYFSGASASIDHTDIYQYQRDGMAFTCLRNGADVCAKRSSVSVQHSTATGLGPVTFAIAQRGFTYDYSTAPVFEHNTSTNNEFRPDPQGPYKDGRARGYEFLCTNVFSAQQLQQQHNTASNDDIPFYVDNNPANC